MSDSSDYFQVIENSEYELIQQSIRQENKKGAPLKVYEVKIKPSKNQVDLNLLQNQYYQLQIHKYGQIITSIQRRFSQFALIFQILSKKEPGFIFPAFPQNGIFAFMKTKVTIIKDEAFINTRIRVIQRFFDKIINCSEFNPQRCKEFKEFISEGKEFQARKQIEKGSGSVFGVFNKIKTFLTISKQNKYKDHEDKMLKIKSQFQFLYIKCHELIELINEEMAENAKLDKIESNGPNKDYLLQLKQLIKQHDALQSNNLKQLQDLEFTLFCQTQDLLMAKKIIDRMNQLKKNQDNYTQLKNIQKQFGDKVDSFIAQKIQNRKQLQQKMQQIVTEIKKVSR